MLNFREIEERIIANGRVDGDEVRMPREKLYADGNIDRQEADFLVVLHKRAQLRTPEFERFFYNAIKDHILIDGRIGAEDTTWLRQMIFHDEKIEDEERQFLRRLNGEVNQASPAFEALFEEIKEQPPERHTSGG